MQAKIISLQGVESAKEKSFYESRSVKNSENGNGHKPNQFSMYSINGAGVSELKSSASPSNIYFETCSP